MSESAIRFHHVSKKFTLHRDRPRSLQELFLSWRPGRHKRAEKLWVLRDVSFDVDRHETLGIIGPNGAGKSTILKLIASIIVPTEGQVHVAGRVSSLLELGAGFHPDLTGRENIFLYGSLLGLGRGTMRQRFDDIVAFSELEEFIDIPVRTYSSGMYLRLAFSVAIHVDPEILLVDEILSVGDQAFQGKCMGRITDLQSKGVTIVYVSHQLGTVRNLCNRAIWMDEGQIADEGPADHVVRRYIDAVARQQDEILTAHNVSAIGRARSEGSTARRDVSPKRWGSGEVQIAEFRILDSTGTERYVFVTNEEMTIRMRYCAETSVDNPVFGLALHRSDGLHITGPNTKFGNLSIPCVQGEGILEYTIPQLPLLPGVYHVSLAVHNEADTRMYDYHDRLYTFSVEPGGSAERYGLMRLGGQWHHTST